MVGTLLEQSAETVARGLIGWSLEIDGVGGTIVETEAYDGDDPASHSFGGPRRRNAPMFGPHGRAYVYRIYGRHWCFNIVCDADQRGSAVLVRAIQPSAGLEVMRARRGDIPDRQLCSGPGRLCDALAIDGSLNGADVSKPPFRLEPVSHAPVIVEGYGLPASAALPVRLAAALARRGRAATVVNAGVSGDTMRDGLRRLDRAVPASTDLCVVALGANDLMQARPPATIRAELDAIIERLLARPTRVLLCGMRAPPWLRSYAPGFDALFPAAARAQGVLLYPFLLEGVALNPGLNLPDHIHPNAAGIDVIADRLAPWIDRALV